MSDCFLKELDSLDKYENMTSAQLAQLPTPTKLGHTQEVFDRLWIRCMTSIGVICPPNPNPPTIKWMALRSFVKTGPLDAAWRRYRDWTNSQQN